MKIMFYINSMHEGGAQRVIKNLAEHFSKNNEVTIITSFIDEWEYETNGSIKRITIVNAKKELGNFIKRNIILLLSLINLIKENKPDVLISFMGETNFRAILACLKTKTKCIVSVRNDPKKEYPNFFMKSIAQVLYKKADAIVFQTKEAKEEFNKKIQDKSRIILNPVDDVFFNTYYCGDRNNIVTVGRLVEQKNHELLIRAFAKTINTIDIVDDLYIYGDGELKEYLINLTKELNISNRVHICGQIKDVANTIKNAKLFILSSNYEGLPNSLMEAMALGLPCVSTDCPCGGPKTLIEDNINGILIGTNRVDILANTLENIITNKEKLNYLGNNAKEKAIRLFKADKIYCDWDNLLH